MKHLSIVISFLLIFAANAISQVNAYNPFYVPRSLPDKDSLKAIVQNSKDPIQKLIALRELGHTYYENKRDSALYYFEQSITAARNIKSRLWEADACNSIGFVSYVQGNYPRGLQFLTQAVSLAEDPASENGEWKPQVSGFVSPRTARLSILARSYQHLAVLYGYTGNHSEYSDKEMYYFGKALEISTSLGDKAMMGIINMNTARHYSFGPHLDSTIFYKERAMELMNEAGYSRYIGTLMFNLGEAYRRHQQPEMAKQCYWYGMEAGKSIENTRSVADNALALANIYQAQLNTDSAVFYGRVAANRYKSTLILSGLADSYAILSSAFNTKNRIDSAFHYQGLSLATRKELDADDKVRRFQQISFDEQIKAQEAAEKDRQVRNRIITSFLLAGLAILALIGVFLYRNNLARKKANQLLEEKNKELEIESALEKVRTRSLAMHKSEELQEVTNTVFEQMRALKIEAQTITIFITIEGSKDYNCWLQNDEQNYFSAIKFPYIKGNTVSEDHQMGSGDIESKTYKRELKDDWFHYMFTKSEMRNIPESRKRFVLDAAYFTASVAEMKYTKIGLYRYTDKAFTNQEYRILKRFAQVFEQAYIRFLDLEKAEGQAREALIEAALERTRTQSMLMQHSDEIRNISEVFHQQLLHLNIPSEFSYVWLPNEEKKDHQFWASWEEHEEGEKVYKSKQVTYPLDKTEPYTAACFAAWASPDPTHVEFIPPADVPTFFEAWKELLEGARNLTASHFPDGIYYAEAYMKYGCFGINIRRELTGDEKEVLRRFSIEFERAYTRFLDLQKAEANAREAQIETALERIRARALAMHSSSELLEVANVLREQMGLLNQPDLETSAVLIFHDDLESWDSWYAFRPTKDITGKIRTGTATFYKDSCAFTREIAEHFISQETAYTLETSGEKREEWIKVLMKAAPEIAENAVNDEIENFETTYFHFSDFKGGSLLTVSYLPPSDEIKSLQQRAANVFDLAYRRFLDLKKAEAQAREAQIEAALERVRAQTMAMHLSTDLANVASVMFEQMRHLGGDLFAFGIVLCDKHKGMVEQWHGMPNSGMMSPFMVPIDLDYIHRYRYDQWKAGVELFSIEIPEHYIARHFEIMLALPTVKAEIERMVASGLELKIPTWEIDYGASFKYGYLLVSALKPFYEEKIFPRFAKVFEQAYTRFLDLQKAEAQAREAQIETALERIRSRSMAMHKSEELSDLSLEVVKQVQLLGVPTWFCAFNIYDDDPRGSVEWGSNGQGTFPKYRTPREGIFLKYYETGHKGETLLINEIKEDECGAHYEYLCSLPGVGDQLLKMKAAGIPFPTYQIDHVAFFKYGYLLFITYEPVPETHEIFKRFAKVFEQSYTRFLDLKKAEAQAREAQIEAALERVRSRSLAMHHTEELQDVVNVAAQQLLKMNIDIDGGMFIAINDEVKDDLPFWAAAGAADYVQKVTLPYFDRPTFTGLHDAILRREPFYTEYYSKEEKDEFMRHMFSHHPWNQNSEERKQELLARDGGYTRSVVVNQYTSIGMTNHHGKIFSNADNAVLKRFGAVVEQSYTRFLDLQKAEAQAREAQIEAALERVRSRTMGMQKSTELNEVAFVLFEQIRLLGGKLWGTGFALCNKPDGEDEFWFANEMGVMPPVTIPNTEDDVHIAMLQGWKENRDYLLSQKEEEALAAHYRYLYSLPNMKAFFDPMLSAGFEFPTWQQWHAAYFSKGYLLFITTEAYSEPDIFKRFAKVFDQTYTRFLDLQRAEAQAREAQVEAALERVRSKTMAMSNSDDVGETVATLFAEFSQLGIHTNRCGILIFDNEDYAEVWTARSNKDGKASLIIGMLDLNAHQMLRSIYNAWKQGKASHRYDLKGSDLVSYYDAINRTDLYPVKFDLSNLPAEEFHSDFYFPEGTVFAFAPSPIEDEHARIMKRFAGVFGQTYRRYLDLQKAEAGAKEAIKQAALDRIRAEIASMRTKQDLDRITPLIWTELKILNIPFLRCGIFIMDDATRQIHTFLSAPDGRAIASFNLAYDDSANITAVVEHWQQNRTYVEHWNLSEFTSLADSLVQQGEISTREQYMRTLPADGLYLHFVPFMQGMLYVGNTTKLSPDEISLLQAVADAFSTAYARYEDFNKVEKTLHDLRQTQKQLVQAEKMASLGELTAGIAHEIQNPLNFVNNFSEINVELVDEINEAADKGDLEEIKALAADIRSNQEKIREHGRRADGIVKGMLQHSRTGGGSTEPTDLNVLAEEYLRLAFHGLRAKDKSFQSDYKFNPDPALGKVNIVPQDIGRVLLNLINNAFYVVQEKAATGIKDYEPRVEVSTERKGKTVVLTVKDNGNGIPENIKDKIFQPFFTTKPTGQGTGLGLSLSYDIVKAHGGELKVRATGKTGTTFEIMLPG